MHLRETFSKFFADRGTHLAAMIAYFALLSFVPLLFLALALFGLSGRVDESSYFVTELQKIFPGASISSIVYGRPNRGFLHGKALAIVFMLGSLVALFAGLVVGGVGAHLLNRFAPGFLGNTIVANILSVIVSSIGIFVFLISAYRYLTNARLTFREVLPGAIVATVALEATFQVLPYYLRLSKHVPAAQAFGGPVLLLIWLFVMANVIVFGAEINWRRARP
jgi:uncharacterized BrkB/YihY/UPF0761 family membrane protein